MVYLSSGEREADTSRYERSDNVSRATTHTDTRAHGYRFMITTLETGSVEPSVTNLMTRQRSRTTGNTAYMPLTKGAC